MADDEPNSGFDWENFHSLNSDRLFSATKQRKEWSMVVIRDSLPDDDYSIFPPSNHENLHLPSTEKYERGNLMSEQSNPPLTSFRSSPSSSSFSSFSFSDDEIPRSSSTVPSDYQVRNSCEASRWMAFAVQVLRSRITAIASTIWSNTARKTVFWLFSPARIGLVVTIWWLYKRARRRQSVDQLKIMVKEKDEKIGQLLHQIAQLNGVLLAQQKSLPSK